MGAPAKILSLQLPLVPLVSLCWPHSQEKYEGWQALFAAVTRDRGRLQWLYCPDCSHHLQTNIRARLVSAVSSVAALVFIVHLENESAFSTRGRGGGRPPAHSPHPDFVFTSVGQFWHRHRFRNIRRRPLKLTNTLITVNSIYSSRGILRMLCSMVLFRWMSKLSNTIYFCLGNGTSNHGHRALPSNFSPAKTY